MADMTDVLAFLVTQASTVLYPNGSGKPSLLGSAVKIYSGWPDQTVLSADLQAGLVHVTASSLPRERVTNRFLGQSWGTQQLPAHTLTASLQGNTVTFSGAVGAQNILVRQSGSDYLYPVQPGDTLASIATALAAKIPGASCRDAVLMLPGNTAASVRVGRVGTVVRELRRQEKRFMLSIWAPSALLRDQAAKSLDTAMAAISNIAFADGSFGVLQYAYTIQSEPPSLTNQFRRDLAYNIDYATTVTANAPEVIALQVNGASAPSGQPLFSHNH